MNGHTSSHNYIIYAFLVLGDSYTLNFLYCGDYLFTSTVKFKAKSSGQSSLEGFPMCIIEIQAVSMFLEKYLGRKALFILLAPSIFLLHKLVFKFC